MEKIVIIDNPEDASLLRNRLTSTGFRDTGILTVASIAEFLSLSGETSIIFVSDTLSDSRDILGRAAQQKLSRIPVITIGAKEAEDVTFGEICPQDHLIKWEFDSRLLGKSIKYAIANHSLAAQLNDLRMDNRKFFDDIPSPIWVYEDETLKFLVVNKAAVDRYGYTREEFSGMTIKDIRSAEDIGIVLESRKHRPGGETYDVGYLRHRKKNGEIFYVHILSHSTKFRDKICRLVLAIDVNDKVLTEQKNVELTQIISKANEALQASNEELESQQEELRQVNEELSQQADALRASEEELRTQEEELRQINAELEEKTEALEQARNTLAHKAQELELSSRYKSEFLANMSHELRTPLNSVLILANLLKENRANNLSEKQIEYAKIIHKSGAGLLDLINDILDLSKIEAGKVDIVIEPVKVKEIAGDMEQLFTVMANEKKITFIIHVDGHVPQAIDTDKQRLEQVIKNLLSNAFKFTPQNGSVTLDFSMQREHLGISVSDTGIGIPPDKLSLIFDAFQQADGSTSKKFGGTGLGLSISKELVARLKGEIKLSSKPGEGSIFTIVLPVAGKQPDVAGNHKQPPVSDPGISLQKVKEQTLIKDSKPQIRPGDQSILIVEDDPIFASIVNNFAQGKGYKTIIAISGDEGLFYAKKYRPSAIILDLGLPVIDGRSVLKILKSDPDLKNIPIHVVTSEERTDLPTDLIESFYQKPLKKTDLEHAFSDIGFYIKERYKNILILSSPNELPGLMFETLTAEMNIGVSYDVTDANGIAKEKIAHKDYDCIIVDIGTDIQKGISTIEELKNISKKGTYLITCLDGNISSNDEKQLKKYSDSIIRKSNQATHRLLDEVDLFLHKIKNASNISVPPQFSMEFDKSLSGKKVLIADDDMRNIFSLTALLEEQGMTVVAAEHGKEALELLAQHTDVDMVLMDIMMPEMDGYETMQHIRANSRHEKLPIIALTAKAMTGDREKCIEAGASDYITKPIDNNKLFSLMRVWLLQ